MSISKSAEKAKKYLKKNNLKGCIREMLEIKDSIERILGIEIDLDEAINDVFRRIRSEGGILYNSERESIRAFIKHKIKKYNHIKMYKATCLVNGSFYDENECRDSFISKYGEKPNKDLPKPSLKLVVGVTATLCGIFILVVPFHIPPKDELAIFLITTGLVYCVDEIVNNEDRKRAPHERTGCDICYPNPCTLRNIQN